MAVVPNLFDPADQTAGLISLMDRQSGGGGLAASGEVVHGILDRAVVNHLLR